MTFPSTPHFPRPFSCEWILNFIKSFSYIYKMTRLFRFTVKVINNKHWFLDVEQTLQPWAAIWSWLYFDGRFTSKTLWTLSFLCEDFPPSPHDWLVRLSLCDQLHRSFINFIKYSLFRYVLYFCSCWSITKKGILKISHLARHGGSHL